MTVAFDNSAIQTAGGANPSLAITPVGTPRGVLVFVSSVVDSVTAITYGGTSMTALPNTPFNGTNGEATSMHVHFLGASVPTGTQTASVTASDHGSKTLTIITLTAADDIEVNEVTQLLDSAGIDDPRATLSLNGVESFVCELWTSGISGVGGVTPITGWTDRGEGDLGSLTTGVYSYDTIASSDVSCGYDSSVSDNVQLLGIALNEVSGGGGGRVMSSLAGAGGLAYRGGIAGNGGGLAG